MLFLAHVSHYLWVLYLPPMLIVLGAIVRTMLLERRQRRDRSGGPSEDLGEPPFERR